MENPMRRSQALRLVLVALPIAALLCSCTTTSRGPQKMDAETMKKVDDLAAKERGEAPGTNPFGAVGGPTGAAPK